MADTAISEAAARTRPVYDSLCMRLDDLWAQYLVLLDQYQSLQQDLAKDIANGHLDLTKANFSNANRIRYGKDYYDGRMQASSRVFYEPERLFNLVDAPVTDIDVLSEGGQSNSQNEGTEKSASSQDLLKGESDKAKKSDVEPTAKDPLYWYGVLAPSILRTSQSAFKSAVEKIVRLASVDDKMKAMEIEIRRMRKKVKQASN